MRSAVTTTMAVVRRSSLLVLCALPLAGCGLADDDNGGVTAVASQPMVAAPEIVVTLPSALDRAETNALDRPVERVETLVEPDDVERPDTIAVVGDSLTVSAREELLAALTGSGMDVVTIDGLESRRMTRGGSSLPPGVSAVAEIRESAEPGIWVIALGTNDVASVGSLDGFRDEVRAVLDTIPDDAPVIWVDLWIGGQEETVSRANLQLRAELGSWQGGSAVVNWFSHGEDDGIITADGVHLTADGQELFAASVAAAVEELFPEG